MHVLGAATKFYICLLLLTPPTVKLDYFPVVSHDKYFPAPAKPAAECNTATWSAPKLQPWDPLRALADSVTVAWMPAWHPWCEVDYYHLEARRPGKFALRFNDLENLQHREVDTEQENWPGDEEWTDWELVYSGLSRAFTMQVDSAKGHAAQFRVRACARRIKPGFNVTVQSGTGRLYEVVKEPYLGMRLHTDRDFLAADLGWFTARRGFAYIRTPMDDKGYTSNTVIFTLNCTDACVVYLCFDYQAHMDEHPWFEAEGWQVDYTTPRPYPRVEMMYKLFPKGGAIPIRGKDVTGIEAYAYGVPLVFVKPADSLSTVQAGLPDLGPGCQHPSAWSPIQTTHTVLKAKFDKVNFYILGMGKNSPAYAEIRVNHEVLYKRRDETGLVVAIFSRLDFSLAWLKTYDTHRNRTASLEMSQDIRRFNQSYFLFVVSSIAWEWQATKTLAHTMEYCGAYHFGQWVHIFAEQPHYESPKSDLQQTASQDEFGHPYVFIGIPGIGTGHGWESLMYNTGHYVPTAFVNPPKAFIRGIAYYDYVARVFRMEDLTVNKADFFIKNRPPASETIHNPYPAGKTAPPLSSTMLAPPYSPYVGTLQHHITGLIEANETVPPFNYAFLLYTIAGVIRVDPRPRNYWITEYERVWSGPSARYWPHNGSLLHNGLLLSQRNCTEYLNWGYAEASPEGCGENFTCNDVKALNDFTSRESMERAGWVFDWDNALSFKPDKYRYDNTDKVPWESYWGLNSPLDGSVSLKLKGTGTLSFGFGNCMEYSQGMVYARGTAGSLLGKEWRAGPLEIDKTVTIDFTHDDVLTFTEFEAVIVINFVEINCWGCCQTTDYKNVIATQCDIGVTPTLCRNLTKFQIQNLSNFRVVDTTPEELAQGTR